MIRIEPKAIYFGPNPISKEPVVVSHLSFAAGAPPDVDAIERQLAEIHRSWWNPLRLESGVDSYDRIAALIVAWSFTALGHVQGFVREHGHRKIGDNLFRVWIGFHQPQVSYSALALAVRQCEAIASGSVDANDIQSQTAELWNGCRTRHPDLQTMIVMEAARARAIPCMPAWDVSQHWQFGWGTNSEVIYAGASNGDGYVASQIVHHKGLAKAMIKSVGLPAPDDVLIDREEEIDGALKKIGFPCVIKPIDQAKGNGVSVGLRNIDQVRSAFAHARKVSGDRIMLERFVPGDDYRLMLAGGRLVGAFRRDPPAVVGDGARTIGELLVEMNRDRGPYGIASTTKLVAVPLDETTIRCLATQGLTPDTVLAPGAKVMLRSNANISSGGKATDVTAQVHPDVRVSAEALAQTLGVNLAGFDYITTDITRSWRDTGGAFIELNLTPSLDVPTRAGWSPVKAGELALGSRPGRIPLDCAIVSRDALAHIEAHFAGRQLAETVGWASHRRAQIGTLDLQVREGQSWRGVLSLLAHRKLQKALLLVDSDHLQKHGFPVDRADCIWNLDDWLPADWLEVARTVSASPVRHVGWHEWLDGPESNLGGGFPS